MEADQLGRLRDILEASRVVLAGDADAKSWYISLSTPATR
jgi:hypothetical protein